MGDETEVKARRPWPRGRLILSICLIPLGGLCWFVGLAAALGAGSSGVTSDDWMVPIGEKAFLLGPFIAGAGVIGLLAILVGRFVSRSDSWHEENAS